MTRSKPRIAIAHDYITQRGGAERVVLAMARAFPDAPIYTTLYQPETSFPEFTELDIRPSALNRVGPLRRHHRGALPFLPAAIDSIHIDADVVISSSSGWAHGVHTNGQKLVYCYSPARWLYQSDVYLGERPALPKALALGAFSPWLRAWDRRAASSATRYLAISTAVQGRIRDAYGLDSTIVPAPHSVSETMPVESVPGIGEDFYLCISRLLPYKNVDKVIEAVRSTPERRLVVVGAGPEEENLRSTLPPNVTMLKNLTDAQIRWLYTRSRAIVAASYEDYGLTPIEAAVFGKPSAVLRWGGFLDTVVENSTGVFFDTPTSTQIRGALDRLEARPWDACTIQSSAARFTEATFAGELHGQVEDLVALAGAAR
ncbi:glycosyltransferase involved in cell wall biosynthesis [Microbacteriaceae bacterium SG_E_30_P1]|uniref:D-inositol 3-phosphate glycosyltransferase n=1 Tax=Antiquaquibacter oligotrophicus TaxID=2880260 RepID=A0ABT6KR63_9MICO|nr:glycosyltransferase [Antiquaquibacter oligotrophicus]MDH6181689.1 glycosyltransferase involved in cell wall biosynthesis [Antiquaquibacter oligotrophicus]UDF12627.1 glycosyltransferase [Antiquaquibacter oligotrophicus]